MYREREKARYMNVEVINNSVDVKSNTSKIEKNYWEISLVDVLHGFILFRYVDTM